MEDCSGCIATFTKNGQFMEAYFIPLKVAKGILKTAYETQASLKLLAYYFSPGLAECTKQPMRHRSA